MSWMNYTEFINPFKKNVNKISIIFNEGARRETAEEGLYLPNQIGRSVGELRANDLAGVKGDWPANRADFGKFIRFELSTFYQNKHENSTQEITKVHNFDSSRDLRMPAGDDTFSIFPRIEITDHIYLMGDYSSDDYKSPKAFTQFKMKLNWLEI